MSHSHPFLMAKASRPGSKQVKSLSIGLAEARFGRTDLRMGICGAKFDGEVEFEVQFSVSPSKANKICAIKCFGSDCSPTQ